MQALPMVWHGCPIGSTGLYAASVIIDKLRGRFNYGHIVLAAVFILRSLCVYLHQTWI